MPDILRRFRRTKPWKMSFPSKATEADIIACFRLLLDRRPSQQEWGGHVWRIGQDLTEVVSSYVSSEEFSQRRLLNRSAEKWQLVQMPDFQMYATPEDRSIGLGIVVNRKYEPEITRIFEQNLLLGMGVLDIGANIGYFSLLAAKLVGPSGFVQAWEPSADNVKVVFANSLLNHFDNIEVIQAAATDKNQVFRYFRNSTNGNVADLEQALPEDMLGAETVMGLRIDDFVPANVQIGLIKIDVEGHEYKAMLGARNTLARCKPVIVTEFSPHNLPGRSGVGGREYLELFTDLGYEIHAISKKGTRAIAADEILSMYEAGVQDHIDILLRPKR
jgi:FkbM family methyltransferase